MANRSSILSFFETVWDDIRNRTSYQKYKLNLKILFSLTILALVMGTVGWLMFGPIKPGVNRERRGAAKACAKAVRDVLRENRGDYRIAVCLPFVGDSSDAIFYETFEELSSSGTFDVKGLSPYNRVRRFLRLSLNATDDAKIAARKARRSHADVALCGAVRRFESTSEGAELVLEYRLIDATTGVEAFSGVYDLKAAEPTASDDATAGTGAERATGTTKAPLTASRAVEKTTTFKESVDGRVVFSDATRSQFFGACWWTLAALAIPILSFPFLEGAAAKRSNAANLFALTSCLAADALCAWLLVAPTFQNWTSWLGVALMALFALWYNFQVLHLAHRRSEPVPAPGA